MPTRNAVAIRTFALVLLVFVLAASPALAGRRPLVERGLVLRVLPHAIVLRELDGTQQRVAIAPRTLILLDGSPATLSALQRGDVVYVVQVGRGAADEVRAFTP